MMTDTATLIGDDEAHLLIAAISEDVNAKLARDESGTEIEVTTPLTWRDAVEHISEPPRVAAPIRQRAVAEHGQMMIPVKTRDDVLDVRDWLYEHCIGGYRLLGRYSLVDHGLWIETRLVGLALTFTNDAELVHARLRFGGSVT